VASALGHVERFDGIEKEEQRRFPDTHIVAILELGSDVPAQRLDYDASVGTNYWYDEPD
jgi:hypothetical protein